MATDETFDNARTWSEGSEDPSELSASDTPIVSQDSATLNLVNKGAAPANKGATMANEGVSLNNPFDLSNTPPDALPNPTPL